MKNSFIAMKWFFCAVQDNYPCFFAELEAKQDYLQGKDESVDENNIRSQFFHQPVFSKREAAYPAFQRDEQVPYPFMPEFTGVVNMFNGRYCMPFAEMFRDTGVKGYTVEPRPGCIKFGRTLVAGE